MQIRNERRLLSVREAAARAGIGRDWAYEHARAGTLPGVVRRGRLYFVVASVLDEALARGWPATAPVDATAHQPVPLSPQRAARLGARG